MQFSSLRFAVALSSARLGSAGAERSGTSGQVGSGREGSLAEGSGAAVKRGASSDDKSLVARFRCFNSATGFVGVDVDVGGDGVISSPKNEQQQ